MYQETGETRDAIIEDQNKELQRIINANKHRTDIYWIVLFAKPYKQYVDGKPTLIQHLKPYGTKPPSMVGVIVGEVCNKKGKIDWEINMPQRPFDFDKLQEFGAERKEEVVVETTTIPHAYITR